MSYKVKSLIYFACFLASSFAYYAVEKESTQITKEIAELTIEDNTLDQNTSVN